MVWHNVESANGNCFVFRSFRIKQEDNTIETANYNRKSTAMFSEGFYKASIKLISKIKRKDDDTDFGT